MSYRRIALLLYCLLPVVVLAACTSAPVASGYGGIWVLTANQRPFVVLTLHEARGTFIGRLQVPAQWSTDGISFSGVGPGVVTRRVARASLEGDTLELTVPDNAEATSTTDFLLRRVDADSADLTIVGAPFPPWRVVRLSRTGATVPAEWDPDRIYYPDRPSTPSNASMRAIYDADQADRTRPHLTDEEWGPISARDAERREQTRALLAAGHLQSGEDFGRAAFIFQHGDSADDALLAHTLAMVALAKGHVGARWIAAASLDKYLLATGRPQVFGTRFDTKGNVVQVAQPFNTGLLSDDLRGLMGVPPLADQTTQFEAAMAARP